MNDDFWSNRFHWCALAAGFLAHSEGRLQDSKYVRSLAYEFYETGAFTDAAKKRKNGNPQPISARSRPPLF